MANHVFFKDLLFLMVGAVMLRTHADTISEDVYKRQARCRSAARGISDASPGCGNGADNSAIIKIMRIVMSNLAMREPPFRGRFPISPMLTAPRTRPRRKPRPRRRGADVYKRQYQSLLRLKSVRFIFFSSPLK